MPPGVNKGFQCTPKGSVDFDRWHFLDVQQVNFQSSFSKKIFNQRQNMKAWLNLAGADIVCSEGNICWTGLRGSDPDCGDVECVCGSDGGC